MSWFISNIFPFLMVLSILVFVHEYGHFWVGRRNGVRVSTFSIGFGPELFGWTDKHETRWRVSLIPLGGYVKFFGDQDVSSTTVDRELENTLSNVQKATMLHNKTPLQRIAVAVAGPAANYLFAIVVLTLLIAIKGMPISSPIIGSITAHSFAERTGLHVKKFEDCVKALVELSGNETTITVDRNGTIVNLEAKLYTEENGQKTPIKKLGIGSSSELMYEKTSVLSAFGKSTHYCYALSVGMLKGLWKMATGSAGGDIGGLISIGDMASKSMQGGFSTLVFFMAMLSVNLGLINLLPVPVLDGGHILFCTLELVRGRALSEKLQERIFMGGLVFVLSLMVYSTGADIVRYKVLSFIGNIIGIK